MDPNSDASLRDCELTNMHGKLRQLDSMQGEKPTMEDLLQIERDQQELFLKIHQQELRQWLQEILQHELTDKTKRRLKLSDETKRHLKESLDLVEHNLKDLDSVQSDPQAALRIAVADRQKRLEEFCTVL